MSDTIKHECGLALIRLLKPLSFYAEKYGTPLYGINRLQLLMQKQRNRGQDGAGLATISLNPSPGRRYISRKRTNDAGYLKSLFQHVFNYFNELTKAQLHDIDWLKSNVPFTGELLLGHLRYGTHGINNIESVHPFLRQSNWISRNLVLAGNFNLTNVDELIQELVSYGQFPKEKSDTVTVLEKIGHFLDSEVERIFNWYKPDGYTNVEINRFIADELNVAHLLKRAAKSFDGGYVMAGLIGHGDAFVLRDPNAIRPAYYYKDEEVVVAASERPAIQTAFNVSYRDIKEIPGGHALIVKKNGHTDVAKILEPAKKLSCSFERIYFSRGTDKEIYLERKKLGELLATTILDRVDYDLDNTVFSYVPNTAETAFSGMIDGINIALNKRKKEKLEKLLDNGNIDPDKINRLFSERPRIENLVVKDAKLRTFITDDASRGDLVSHVYDVSYGIVQNNKDTLVLMDDSIVRGTTLRDSIIRITSRLRPKKIIIISSAPQIRYPDCYGIDMSRMSEFVAFRALVALIEEQGSTAHLDKVYKQCKKALADSTATQKNYVQELYKQFSTEAISKKIAELVRPPEVEIPIEIIYQSIEGLHQACPDHKGDWYFTGNYPTPGGNKIVNRAFVNYMEKNDVRSYEMVS